MSALEGEGAAPAPAKPTKYDITIEHGDGKIPFVLGQMPGRPLEVPKIRKKNVGKPKQQPRMRRQPRREKRKEAVKALRKEKQKKTMA